MRLHETRSATPCLDSKATPELKLPVNLVRLATINWDETDTLLLHPPHGATATLHQKFAKVGISTIFRDPSHVVEELVFAVSAKVGIGNFLRSEVGHERLEVVDAVIDATKCSSGEMAVSTSFRFRCALKHQYRYAQFNRSVCRAERCVAGSDDNDICRVWESIFHSVPSASSPSDWLFKSAIEFWKNGEQISNQSVICNLEDRSLLVFIDRDDNFGVFHTGEMLDRSGNTNCYIKLRRYHFSSLPNLPIVRSKT